MCMGEMAAIDAKGGVGMAGINNLLPLTYDKSARRGAVFGPSSTYLAGICRDDAADTPQSRGLDPAYAAPLLGPLRGAGLRRPGYTPIDSPAGLSLAGPGRGSQS